MKLRGLYVVVAAGFFIAQPGHALTSLDVLNQDLTDAKTQHDAAKSAAISNLLQQLDSAMHSTEVALDLYVKAGGKPPDLTAVTSEHTHETTSEREDREAKDAAKSAGLMQALTLHCGLMRFGAQFVATPDVKGLHDDWITWLNAATRAYPQVDGAREVKAMAIKDSIISSYLGFFGWGDKPQGTWRVKDIPDIYRREILEPLRSPPRPEVLASWDVYIAARQPEAVPTTASLERQTQAQQAIDRWNRDEYPSLMFQRSMDDYTLAPSVEKLSALVSMIKANPTHSEVDSWISQVQGLMQAYKQKGATPAAPTTTN